MAAPTRPRVDPLRESIVDRARKQWIDRLTDTSRRNNLLYFRDLKTGTLDLTGAAPGPLRDLLGGKPVTLSGLLPADLSFERNLAVLREIQRRAQSNLEEKGLQTLFLAVGMATWDVADGGRPPEAAVLLLPVAVDAKGREGTRLTLRRDGDAQVNLVLLQVLATEHACHIAPEELLAGPGGLDEEEGLDQEVIFQRLQEQAGDLKGFAIGRRVVLGNFSFQKMAMVNDLRQRLGEMTAHDLIAAIAGDKQAAARVSGGTAAVDPRTFDRVPPDHEFLVVDADSSQQEVITLAQMGSHGVIQGPPGTGKSQTIVNLITTLAAGGKRILFVAEKRAALDVVKRRLTKAGLGHLVLDLHGAEVSRREIMQHVAESLRLVRESTPVNASVVHERVQDRRTKLNEHTQRMHTPRLPSGHSVYDLQGELLRLPAQAASHLRWRGDELRQLERKSAERSQELLREAGAFAALFLKVDPSRWTHADLPDASTAQQAVDLATSLAFERGPALQDALEQALRETRLQGPTTLVQVDALAKLLGDVRATLEQYQGALYQEDLPGLIQTLAPAANGGIRHVMALLLHGSYRQALQRVRTLRRDGKGRARQLRHDLQQAQDQLQRWRSQANLETAVPLVPANLSAVQTHLANLRAAADGLVARLGAVDYATLDLGELQTLWRRLVDEQAIAERIPGVRAIERELQERGAGRLVAELRTTKPPASLWPEIFRQAWLSSCLDLARAEEPQLVRFSGQVHSGYASDFTQYDRQRLTLAAERVRRSHAEHAVAVMNQYPEQAALVRREADKQTRHMQLRKLLAQAPDVLLALFPCCMASPLSVSQLMDADRRYFDVVLFDEASQVLPEDAIPALLRAGQAVVAGDEHQLPPSLFFADGSNEEDEDAEEGVGTQGYESLLKVMAGVTGRSWWLKWHYRSQDESLIAFSNRHIYEEQLVTFPGVGGPPVISHVWVDQETGQDGQEESSGLEVRRVVELILAHAEQRPQESLGVIAMGLKHANRIQALLDAQIKYRPDLDAFFDESKSPEERYFIKNLERVQGDERDAIILTVGYGKDRAGKLPYRFGPLLYEGGERRLNVAITRAKKRLTLVSSFTHVDMDPGRSKAKGVELLRLYLQYAASQARLLGDTGRSDVPLNPFEEDVRTALQARGLALEPQWGVSNYRLDFAVKHPRTPGRFVLAIEADGATYHSAPTARDRDRLRQQHLEALGWRFHRIWSTDWFTRRDEEIARAVAAYEQAVAYADEAEERQPGATPGAAPADLREVPKVVQLAPKRGARPPVPLRESIDLYGSAELVALVQWIQSDGRLRTDEEILREMVVELGFKRRGAKIEDRVAQAIARVRAR